VWAALAPVTKRRLTIDVGAHTLALAQCAGPQGAQVWAPDGMPLVLTDGDQAYVTALLSHGGQWAQPPRRQANGPTPKPRGMPLPQWLYASVVQQSRRRRLVGGRHRVVFGSGAGVKQVVAPPKGGRPTPPSWRASTSPSASLWPRSGGG
jgi:hypothetical protein